MSSKALPLAVTAFATWAVYLGGLASLQADCDSTREDAGMMGMPGVSCYRYYRFWWFIMSWEFVCIAGLAIAAVTNKLPSMKLSFLGLFAVGTLLYIEASNSFLTAGSSIEYYNNGQPQHRIRTITAGSIMTALMNAVIVFVLGMNEECAATEAPVAEKAAV